MATRIHGAATAHQNLSGDLQFYLVFCLSPYAYSNPNPNPDTAEEELLRCVNIQTTGDIRDQSQKNFEILFQSIGLRAVPVVMSDPEAVANVAAENSTLAGEGFVWKFAVERADTFMDYKTNDPVGLLVKEIDGVIIDSGVRLTTVDGSPSGVARNIEFFRIDGL